MLFDPLGLEAAPHHPRCRGTDLVLRFQVDPLRCKAAVIDPRIDIEFGKALVDVACPTLAPLFDEFGAVPVAGLRAEPRSAIVADDDFAHRQDRKSTRLNSSHKCAHRLPSSA